MEIHVDYNPSPKDHFFISVLLNDRECISFDHTIKGHRIIKQVFREETSLPPNTKFTSEWDTLILKDGKLTGKFHMQWVDMGRKDWLNGEVWETTWEKPIEQWLGDKLLHYSQLVSDHYDNLAPYAAEIRGFEELLAQQVEFAEEEAK